MPATATAAGWHWQAASARRRQPRRPLRRARRCASAGGCRGIWSRDLLEEAVVAVRALPGDERVGGFALEEARCLDRGGHDGGEGQQGEPVLLGERVHVG